MLPNHSPLVIAEQFGTLEALHPGRIDLGLGRAPGTDHVTARALRRDPTSADAFPQDVLELQHYLAEPTADDAVRAIPGIGARVPIWILGSSLYGAQLAALLGLPYAFASHFAPDALLPALETYRAMFKPSEQLARAARDGRRKRDRRRDRRPGTASLHLGPTSIHQHPSWTSGPACPTDRRHRGLLDTARKRASLGHAPALVRRGARHRPCGSSRVRNRDSRRRDHRRRSHPRPPFSAPLLRTACNTREPGLGHGRLKSTPEGWQSGRMRRSRKQGPASVPGVPREPFVGAWLSQIPVSRAWIRR